MGIFGAMTTAISGINAQAYALEHISDNIANSQTTGFKRTETVFSDLVSDSLPGQQAGGSVQGLSRATNTVGGDIQASDVDTHMAVSGDGYFIVAEKTGESDGTPIFSDTDRYTRRGDFELDKNGNLANSAGYYLMGLAIDNSTGNPAGGSPEVVQVTNDFLPAETTTTITYKANLANYPLTANSDPDTAGSEYLDATDFTNDPTTSGVGTVLANELTTFLDETIAGGAVTAYDSTGAPVNVQFRWGKISSTTWNLFYQTDPAATGTDVAWTNTGTDYVFNSSGQLSPSINSATISALTVSGTNLGNITLNHGSSAVTSYADANGVATVNVFDQDGYSAGELSGVYVSDAGRIVGSYTNGESLELYEVTLASFNADGELRKLDGGAFASSSSSGNAIIGAQGSVVAGRLEGSNSDIASEFSKLIVTQQAYAAGTRIVTTSNEMLQEVLNMKR